MPRRKLQQKYLSCFLGGSNFSSSGPSFSPSPADLCQQTNGTANSPLGSPTSPSNSNPPSNSAQQQAMSDHPQPSISLIPIKQEPNEDGSRRGADSEQQQQAEGERQQQQQESALSLIKVSPLKSLLREVSSPRRCRASALAQCLERPPRGGSMPPACCQCVHCGIVFPDQTLYFLHKGCHSDSNPWKCNICGEQCSNIYDFNSHLLSKTHQ
jgi:IKAROS family zinc finger protein